jgi:2-C-methyl-D-erythritol 2,4-cyclodiphosphate synthase
MRDIGYHFPPVKGNEYENIDSKILLRRVMEMLREEGYELGNCDCTICAEAPKLNPHISAMTACLAEVMGVEENQISIKATTTEQLGFVGRKEGIAAQAVALIIKN